MTEPTAGQKGKVEILAYTKGQTHKNVLEMIELAGRTCYKSTDRITPGSAEKFIATILKSGHESVIEHSWFVFLIKRPSSAPGDCLLREYLFKILMKNGLLSLTEEIGRFVLSGNARMFRDYFRRPGYTSQDIELPLTSQLMGTPALFSDLKLELESETEFFIPSYKIAISPDIDFTRQEKLAHFWAMARFTGCSRAFTHQLVRHRPVAISQESQRYCDESGFFDNGYFVVPPSFEAAGYTDWYLDKLRKIDGWYKAAQELPDKSGHLAIKNEDARFLLPNAVCSEIVMSANLLEWRWILKMRCNRHAQWEIRQVAIDLLRQFQTLFPDCFDDFAVSEDEKSAELIN